MVNSKEMYLRTVSVFIIALMISLPFDFASVMAESEGAGVQVQITKNSGQKNIEDFIDAQGDVWTVQALLSGLSGAVDPNNVVIQINEHDAPFKTCSDSSLGVLCEYISPLTDGLEEATYNFRVIYQQMEGGERNELGSQGGVVNADGSAPKITFNTGDAAQTLEGKVSLKFTVSEAVNPDVIPVGIKQIEIIDGDKNTVLQTLSNFEAGVNKKVNFDYAVDGGSGGILAASFEGEGVKKIKIKAEDWLGHITMTPAVPFAADFVLPVIKEESLEFVSLGKFLGEYIRTTDIKLDVIEKSQPKVLLSSEQLSLQGSVLEGKEADNNCVVDDQVKNLWHCQWNKIEVKPSEAVSLKVVASDLSGNKVERTITKAFTKDTSAPEIVYFGSERNFENKFYVNHFQQRVILKFREQGVGMSEENNWEGIRTDLRGLGEDVFTAPTFCNMTEANLWECYWETEKELSSGGEVTITLSKFEDKVGNAGELKSVILKVDDTGPKVEKMSVFGVSTTGEEKNYFQSADKLRFKMKISEGTGLVFLVNLEDIVLNAEDNIDSKFPENEYTHGLGAGWFALTEKNCQRVKEEGGETAVDSPLLWDCVFETEPIKSGPENGLRLEIKVRDTAGNEVSSCFEKTKNVEFQSAEGGSCIYKFDLLGMKTEDNPNYWEVKRVTPSVPFVDLDTTTLTPARIPFTITLSSAITNVEAIDIKLTKCLGAEESGNTLTGMATEVPPEVVTPEAVTEGVAPAETSNMPQLSRSLLYGGVSVEGVADPKPKIILEFEPFDGREIFKISETAKSKCKDSAETCKWTAEYVCQLRIFSKVGDSALLAPEMQIVKITVPFGFSSLGAQDENLEELIRKSKEEVETGFYGAIGSIAKVLRWVEYASQLVSMGLTVIGLFKGVQMSTAPAKETPARATVIGICVGMQSSEKVADTSWVAVDFIMQLLACSPITEKVDTGWYGIWVKSLLKYYNNLQFLKSPDSPASIHQVGGLKENMFLSIAGLCVPGILQNLDKLRQIKCRKIYCLENEVKGNLATVKMCSELEDLLFCKYWAGQLWYLIPGAQLYDFAIGKLGEAWKDPLALAHTATILGCGIPCYIGDADLAAFCSYAYYIWDWVGLVESLIGFVMQVKNDWESGGLQYCDSVLK